MPRQLLISILNPLPLATTVHIVFTLYQLHVTLLSPLNIMLAFFSYFFFFFRKSLKALNRALFTSNSILMPAAEKKILCHKKDKVVLTV